MNLLGEMLKSSKHVALKRATTGSFHCEIPISTTLPITFLPFFLDYRTAPHTIFSFSFWYNE